ncbi:MAG TPA: tetratricopeptide repeat protein [Planctomycetota bacterium]|nr:tetratricopeptide repeat protein [Planctomycetota bacterium]
MLLAFAVLSLGALDDARAGPIAPAPQSAPAPRSGEARPTVIEPSHAASGNESRFAPWVPKIGAAIRDLERGKHDDARAVFEELLRLDRSNPIARLYLVELRIREGDFDGARALAGRSSRRREAAEPIALKSWWILGPFEWKGHGRSLSNAYPPEGSMARFDPLASFPGDGRICRWKEVEGPRLDFRDELEVEGAAVGYGYCQFVSKRAGWVRIGFASADGMKAWLNGQEILVAEGRRSIQEDDDLVWAFVRRGANHLFIKVESDGGAFRGYVQVHCEVEPPATDFLEAAIAGKKALAAGKTQDAEVALLEAEGLEPGHPDIALSLADVSLRRGDPISARSWALRAIEGRPGWAQALAIHAESLFLLENPVKAFDTMRAAYRASDLGDAAIHARWVEWARKLDSPLEEALAELERARGLEKSGKKKEAEELIAKITPALEGAFVGLAELSDRAKERGDRAAAVALALRALDQLTPEQIAEHCSIEWLAELLRMARGDDRKRLLAIAEEVGVAHPSFVALRIESLSASSADAKKRAEIAAQLERHPSKDGYKVFASWLRDQKLHEEVVGVCRAGLRAGIISRKLRLWLGEALVELRRYDEAREAYETLVSEPSYETIAREALERIESARR